MSVISRWPALTVLGTLLLTACQPEGGASAPATLAVAPPSAAQIKQAEQKAYWRGFSAGRHYQAEKASHLTTPTTPADLAPPQAPTTPPPPRPAPAPAPLAAPPPKPTASLSTYQSSGTAQPIPGN
jgi:hypothetical protein